MKQNLKAHFLAEYNKLNEQQRIAVDSIQGPVMVIAGPGTGKTQILASRIGKILLETDAEPDNILCLTYTDAGVVAMRKRLLQFIGPDAYKVNLYTFHAFCNDVIQDNLSLFEKNSLDAISDLEKIQLLKELIDTLPKNHPLKRYRGDVYYEVKHLQSLFSSMKREGWTPAFLNEKIDAYLNDIPTREEFVYKRKYRHFNAGDLKEEKIQEEKEKMEKLRAAVNEFDRFQQLMRKKNRYDFDDMINWVIDAFTTNKNLLSSYQERFQYILVDEYQDTSGTQNKLVELLLQFWDAPNIFVVGDDDQSIFRFQGANVENMLEFAGNYQKDLLTVVLTSNYRSVQPVLDVSKGLIGKNQERLIRKIPGLSKELVAANEQRQVPHVPHIKKYDTQRHEMIGVVKEVEALLQAGETPGKIGIIYKENKYGQTLARYFALRNIGVYTKKSVNLLELPFAQKIILLLEYLAAEHDIPYGGDEMLFELLHFDWFGIPPIEIAKLSIEVAERKFSAKTSSIRQLLAEKVSEIPRDLFSKGIHEGLKRASIAMEELIAAVPNHTVQTLFEMLVRKTGILHHIMQSPDKHAQLQMMSAFFDFIKEETHRNPQMNLAQLVGLIELMQRESIALPLVQISGSDKAVNLMTAHGSKGLEFRHVFLVGCNAGSWEKKRKPGSGFAFPDTVFDSQPKTTDEEELRRLFYVALTRAEEYLHISYAAFRQDGKEIEPSMFIAEIQASFPSLQTEAVTLTQDEESDFAVLEFTEAAPEIEKIEKELVTRLLEKFSMNVTALNNYLKCPLEFYFKNLIRIPSPKNEATEFGSSVHHALEQLFRKMQANGRDQFEPKDSLIKDFEWYMRRHRESFTREQFDRRMEYGREILSNYYDKYVQQFNTVVAIERNIRNVVVEGVPLKGKLDKLEFDGKQVNVVDYKTGDPEKALPKLKGPNAQNKTGGDYWRQAVFYKILVDNYEQRDWKVVSTEFDFVEPDKKKNFRKEKVVIQPADTQEVMQQVKEVWHKIQQHDFYTGCGKEDCHWCNFVKTNHMTVALHELPEEE